MPKQDELVDWQGYIARSEYGAPLEYQTLEKFKDHLNHFLMLRRLGESLPYDLEVQTMELVNWSEIAKQHTAKNGDIDVKAATSWFGQQLAAQVQALKDAAEAKANFQIGMEKAIHGVFDEAGTNLLPKDVVIQYALRSLKIPMSLYAESKEALQAFLDLPDGDFGSKAGAGGGMARKFLPSAKKGEDKTATEYAEVKSGKATRKSKK
jgi:hypothetical protein